MDNEKYRQLEKMARELESSYFENDDKWANSSFKWIKERPIKKIGEAGEQLISQFLQANQFLVSRAPGTAADIIINGKRVEIKFATLSAGGKYIFNQIRDQEYDILLCVGVSPMEAHGWVSPKSRINDGNFPTQQTHSERGKYSFNPQHGGRGSNANTWQIALTVPLSPPWMKPHDGNLSAMCDELHKLTGGSR